MAVESWETYDPYEKRRAAIATLTLTTRGLYFTRAATLMMPKYIRYVRIQVDKTHMKVRVVRCPKSSDGARKFRRSKHDFATVSGGLLMELVNTKSISPGSRFAAKPVNNGIEIDLLFPLAMEGD